MSFDERLCHPTQASHPSIQCIYSVCYLRQSPRRCLSCHSSLQLCHNACVPQPTYLSTQIRCSPCYHRRIRLRMEQYFSNTCLHHFLLLYRLIIIYFLINYCSSLAMPNLFTKLGHRHAWIVTFSICGGSRSTSLDKEKLWRSFFSLKKKELDMVVQSQADL